MRAVRLRVFLRFHCTRDVASHEGVKPRVLTFGKFSGRFGMNPCNRAECFFHIILSEPRSSFFIVHCRRLRDGNGGRRHFFRGLCDADRGHGRTGLCRGGGDGRLRGESGITLQQRDLLGHQLHLLLNDLLDK